MLFAGQSEIFCRRRKTRPATLGHLDTELDFHDIRDAALTGLAVDADHRLAGADIGRINRQVGNVRFFAVLGSVAFRPLLIASQVQPEKAVKTRSPAYGWRGGLATGYDSAVARSARMLRMSAAVEAVAHHVHGERDNINVAGALAVAEERALDPVSARQFPARLPQRRSAVVVRCRERITFSRVEKLRCIHSMPSA